MTVQHPSLTPVVLAACANEAFALPATVTLASAVRRVRNDRPVRAYLIDGGFEPATLQRMERLIRRARPDVDLRVVQPALETVKRMHAPAHLTFAAYLRVLLPDTLPHEDRCLYLDSDTVACDDVSPLYETELGDALMAARQELTVEHMIPEWQELGMRPDVPAFNSGVMVMNLRAWRDENVAEKTFDLVTRRPELMRYADQSALNVLLAGRWKGLNVRWNMPYSFQLSANVHRSILHAQGPMKEELLELGDAPLESAGIVHYLGWGKPWRFTPCPGAALWFRAAEETGWFEEDDSAAAAAGRRARVVVSEAWVRAYDTLYWLRRRPAVHRLSLPAVRAFAELERRYFKM